MNKHVDIVNTLDWTQFGISIATMLWFGFFGKGYAKRAAEKQGYKVVATVEAHTRSGAMAEVAGLDPAPGERQSLGTSSSNRWA